MSNWYTSVVPDGCSFEDFVLRCATQYLGPYEDGTRPALLKADEEYLRKAEEAEAELSRLYQVPMSDVRKLIQDEQSMAMLTAEKLAEEQAAAFVAYTSMQERVTAWKPPEGLENLRMSMLMMLKESREWDCRPVRQVFAEVDEREWLAERIAKLEERAKEARLKYDGSVAFAEKHNKAVRALYESLGVAL